MATKVTRRAAAVMASAHGKPVLVHGSLDGDLLNEDEVFSEVNEEEFTEHVCSSCGTHLAVTASTNSPFCVTCGSSEVKATKNRVQASFRSDAELTAVTCRCGTHNIMATASATALKGSAFCVTCGTDLANTEPLPGEGPKDLQGAQPAPKLVMKPNVAPIKADLADDNLTSDDVDLVSDPVLADGEFPEEGLDDPSGAWDNVSASDDDEEDDGDDGLDEDGDEVTADAFSALEDDEVLVLDSELPEDQPDMVFDSGIGLNPDGSLADDNGTIGLDQRIVPENDMLVADADEMIDMPTMDDGDDLLTLAGFDDTTRGLTFASVGNKLVALRGTVSVATLTPADAKQNRDVMHKPTFAQAVYTVASRSGLQKALAQFGFKTIKLASVNKASVQRQVNAFKEQASVEQRKREQAQAKCFALAAAALSAGRFRGVANPLAEGLVAEFQRLGVRRPAPIVAAMLRQHGMKYAEVLVTQAAKLGMMSEAARKEVADVLDLIETPAVEEQVADLDDELTVGLDPVEDEVLDDTLPYEDVTARLATPGLQHKAVASYLTPRSRRVQASGDLDASAEAQRILFGR